jgi:hypothetical protein
MTRGSRLASALACLFVTVAAQAGDFIRVEEDAASARLETAITRYEKDGASVELVGAIHIADRAYYQALGKRFATYDELLFEMIGGEKLAAKPVPDETPAPKKDDLSGLHRIYDMAARFLQLTGQMDQIDYTAANFVHADLTLAEFAKMQSDRGESLIGFALAAGKADENAPNPLDPKKLLRAILSGSPAAVKLQLVHTLGQGADQIAALTGESVVVTDRNARCMEVLARELAAGHTNLGIFYGAAHFPDMEKRLLEMGFTRTRQEWLTAWDIPKPAAKPAAAGKKAA